MLQVILTDGESVIDPSKNMGYYRDRHDRLMAGHKSMLWWMINYFPHTFKIREFIIK